MHDVRQNAQPAQLEPAVVPAAAPDSNKRTGVWRRFRRNRLAMASALCLAVIFVITFIGPLLYAHGYEDISTDYSQAPSAEHWMGTDAIGHDLFAQVMRGAQKSIEIALMVAVMSTLVGVVLGTVAGYYRGWVDVIVARATDLILVLPILAILLAAANTVRNSSGNWWMVALLLAAFLWPPIALVTRSTVLTLREREFIEAQVAIGSSDLRIIVRHVIPNAVGPVLVSATLLVVTAILLESSLAFLGFGVSPPDTSLGKLVAGGVGASNSRPWLFYFPGVVLLFIALCINFIGDGLRQAFDTRQVTKA